MAQLSRPYQIALSAIAVLGLVWAVALRGHASNPSEPAPTSSTAAPSSKGSSSNPASGAKSPAAPTPVYHGAAPGVEGLTRAIAKAHGAVATSQQNARELQSKSGAASSDSQSTGSPPAVASTKNAGGAAATQKAILAATLARRAAARAHTNSHRPKSHIGRTLQQIAVEAVLAHGKTVMLVFWNPRSSVDQEVKAQANALAAGSKGTVTMHAALPHQVGMFGKITEVVHVYQTPTILIVNKHGVVSTLTGLTDVFALRQAVQEARAAKP
jgi:hypothetical protein